MADKPGSQAGYRADQLLLVRQTCLYVATLVGDMRDEWVVVGGLVPSLIVPQGEGKSGAPKHVGTMDLDLGLALAILNDKHYHELSERLRRADFRPDKNDSGKFTHQRWKLDVSGGGSVKVDFLIPPGRNGSPRVRIKNLEKDFAALVTPALGLAFQDRIEVTLEGTTIRGEKASRKVWVSGPGAYLVLKALAFENRGERKDAYDLHYVLKYFGKGVVDVYERFEPFLRNPLAQRSLEVLRRDFGRTDSLGAKRVANFIRERDDDEIQADVASDIAAFLKLLPR